MANTAIFAIVGVLFQMVLGFALALLTTQVTRGRVLYRTVFILPILVPGIVIGAIWKLMYNFDFGVVNQMIGLLGIGPVDWLGRTSTALLAVIAVDVWHWTPFVFLLMLAGLESLPQDVYEAARIDGATFLQQLRYVTLPLMLPVIVVTLVFRIIVGVKVFDEIYLLTGGGPGTATEVVSYTIFRRFFTEGQTGYGAAMSVVVLFALALIFLINVIPAFMPPTWLVLVAAHFQLDLNAVVLAFGGAIVLKTSCVGDTLVAGIFPAGAGDTQAAPVVAPTTR